MIDPLTAAIVITLLHLDGQAVRVLPYQQRRDLLVDLTAELPTEVARIPRTFTVDEGLEHATLSMGLEGVIAKRRSLASPWPARRWTWIKFKHRHSERMAVVGWGRRPHGDELLVADPDGRPCDGRAFVDAVPGGRRRRRCRDGRRCRVRRARRRGPGGVRVGRSRGGVVDAAPKDQSGGAGSAPRRTPAEPLLLLVVAVDQSLDQGDRHDGRNGINHLDLPCWSGLGREVRTPSPVYIFRPGNRLLCSAPPEIFRDRLSSVLPIAD